MVLNVKTVPYTTPSSGRGGQCGQSSGSGSCAHSSSSGSGGGGGIRTSETK